MRICLVLEGCYPYVHGGVSTWMHGYIQAMPEYEFVLWVIGAHAVDRGKFVYELPGNVVEVHEVFLDDALRLSGEQEEADFNAREREALRRLPEQFRQAACAFLFIFCRYPTLAMKPLIFCAASFFMPAVTWVYTSSENSAEA